MKKTRKFLVLVAIFAMVAMTLPVKADRDDHEIPAENDPFWTFFAAMNHPSDTAN